MIYRELGQTGKLLSLLSLGTMRLPRISVKASTKLINEAYKLGINFFETSPGYKDAERKLGIAIEHIGRKNVYISTKSHPSVDNSPERLKERMQSSLERLNTKYIDLYQVWGLNTREDFDIVFSGGIIEELQKAKKQGLIRHIGFTSHAGPALIKEILDSKAFESAGLIFNLFKQENQEIIDYAHKLSMGVIAIAPLCNGFLAHPTEKMKKDFYPEDVREYSIRWLCNDDRITTIPSGMKTMKELTSNYNSVMNFKTFPKELAEKEKQSAIKQRKYQDKIHEKRVWKLFKERNAGEYCYACEKCMPCHKSINIPELMRLNNIMNAYDAEYYCKNRYKFMGNGGSWYSGVKANACDDCGECEPKCPYNIKIVSIIKDLHKKLYDGERGPISVH